MLRPNGFVCIYLMLISSFAMEPSENRHDARKRLNSPDFRPSDSQKIQERFNLKKRYFQPQAQENLGKNEEKFEGRPCAICTDEINETDERISLIPREIKATGPK